jgi:hypothetical protein
MHRLGNLVSGARPDQASNLFCILRPRGDVHKNSLPYAYSVLDLDVPNGLRTIYDVLQVAWLYMWTVVGRGRCLAKPWEGYARGKEGQQDEGHLKLARVFAGCAEIKLAEAHTKTQKRLTQKVNFSILVRRRERKHRVHAS